MKSSILETTFKLPFEAVYNAIKKNILSNGFLLLHEINTQEIVAKHDLKIRPLKQLLFFHPRYIETILNEDALAINEIPIKIVVYEKENGNISVSFPNPKINLGDYNCDEEMASELLEKTNTILDI
ncbi:MULTISPECIES: DUF302 domain-containing protein [Aquimarina]|uniref:DUF302 domain-containing protein n=1 Tax=Aquimarina TaxID=290174 RepID=UPI000944D4DA|nr:MULTISPECIES: DUF302 domain-containing protein [Aquimarina]